MGAPRIYTDQALAQRQSLRLEAAPSHHILRVLRLRPGDPLVVFNGDGKEFSATLTGVEGKLACLAIGDAGEPRRESNLRISLGQGVSRGERMDMVMQKAVELGVYAITPLWTRRSQVQLGGKRLEKRLAHWHGIVRAACEQSGRVRLPVLNSALDLGDWLRSPFDDGGMGIMLDPDAEMALGELEPVSSVRVLIGPEGGFDSQEVESANAAGYRRVRLGPRVLRTETATIATLSALQTLWGDFAA
jgi:16S rRNA (uracil1498-N3)-methyltransferase